MHRLGFALMLGTVTASAGAADLAQAPGDAMITMAARNRSHYDLVDPLTLKSLPVRFSRIQDPSGIDDVMEVVVAK